MQPCRPSAAANAPRVAARLQVEAEAEALRGHIEAADAKIASQESVMEKVRRPTRPHTPAHVAAVLSSHLAH
jgi:hypothetical protein